MLALATVLFLLMYGAGYAGTMANFVHRDDDPDTWGYGIYAGTCVTFWPVYWACRALAPVTDRLMLPPGPGEGV